MLSREQAFHKAALQRYDAKSIGGGAYTHDKASGCMSFPGHQTPNMAANALLSGWLHLSAHRAAHGSRHFCLSPVSICINMNLGQVVDRPLSSIASCVTRHADVCCDSISLRFLLRSQCNDPNCTCFKGKAHQWDILDVKVSHLKSQMTMWHHLISQAANSKGSKPSTL